MILFHRNEGLPLSCLTGWRYGRAYYKNNPFPNEVSFNYVQKGNLVRSIKDEDI